MTDVRNDIISWAKWFADNKHTHPFNYSEGPERMAAIGEWPVKYPVTCDCSAFVTLCYWLAGAADPNGQGYDHEGYTGTLLSHGHEIVFGNNAAGDVIVYGPGTGWHTAIIVEAGPDPLTVSMGEQGDPSYVRVSQDGRLPQRILRFNTTAVAASRTPEIAAAPHPEVSKIATPDVAKLTPAAPVSHPEIGSNSAPKLAEIGHSDTPQTLPESHLEGAPSAEAHPATALVNEQKILSETQPRESLLTAIEKLAETLIEGPKE